MIETNWESFPSVNDKCNSQNKFTTATKKHYFAYICSRIQVTTFNHERNPFQPSPGSQPKAAQTYLRRRFFLSWFPIIMYRHPPILAPGVSSDALCYTAPSPPLPPFTHMQNRSEDRLKGCLRTSVIDLRGQTVLPSCFSFLLSCFLQMVSWPQQVMIPWPPGVSEESWLLSRVSNEKLYWMIEKLIMVFKFTLSTERERTGHLFAQEWEKKTAVCL